MSQGRLDDRHQDSSLSASLTTHNNRLAGLIIICEDNIEITGKYEVRFLLWLNQLAQAGFLKS